MSPAPARAAVAPLPSHRGEAGRSAPTAAPVSPAPPEPAGAGSDVPNELVAIGAAAALAGVSERTLRYYEELGLVVPAGHSPGGSRRYAAEQVERVRRIRELQELAGLNLEEIGALLRRDDRRPVLRAAWEASEDPASRQAILDEGITADTALLERLLAKRARIDGLIDELGERLARYRSLLPTGSAEQTGAGVRTR